MEIFWGDFAGNGKFDIFNRGWRIIFAPSNKLIYYYYEFEN